MGATPHDSFGALLKGYRRAAGLTQEALAEHAGYSAVYVGMLERGQRLPLPGTVSILADALALCADDRAVLHRAAARPLAVPARPDAAPMPPLVGRRPELSALEEHLDMQGPPLLVLAGEPGIGKTRLLEEATRLAEEGGWTVLAGGCWRRGGHEPYAPFVDAVERHMFARSPARLRADLQGCTWLVRLMPELADGLREPLPHGMMSPEQERRLMFAAVGRYLDNVAGPAGTLVLLDDLQWADPDALDLLVRLVHAPHAAARRIIGAYRDSDVQPSDPLSLTLADLAHAGLVTRRVVGPLPPVEAAHLLDGLLAGRGGGSAGALEAVPRRVGGVPFALVSYAHALSAGTLAGGGDAGAPGRERLPWDLAQSLRQRVAALPARARELLAAVAVVGGHVPGRLLVAVAAGPEAETVAALEAAVRARLLEAEGEGYRFVHDVIREVVEADLGAVQRRALHRGVAEALEQAPGPDEAGRGERPLDALAYHYQQCGDRERTVRYLEQAGDRARAQVAHAAAEAHYRDLVRRLDELGRTEDAAGAREKLAAVQGLATRYDAALATLEQAASAYGAAGDLEGLARVGAQIGWVHAGRRTPEEGIRRTEAFVRLLAAAEASQGLAALYVALAHLLFVSGRYAEQLAAAERAADLARAEGDDHVLAAAESRRGTALLMAGREGEAIWALEAASAAAEAVGDLDSLWRALGNTGAVHLVRGDFGRARTFFERASDVARREGDLAQIASAAAKSGLLAYYSGEWARADAEYERAMDLSRQAMDLNGQMNVAMILAYRALLRLGEGAWDEAGRLAGDSLAAAGDSGDLQLLRMAHAVLAERDLLEGHPESARARLLPLLDRPGQQDQDVTALVLSSLAWADLELGDLSGAAHLAAQAATRARSTDNRLALVHVVRVQALVAARQGQWPEARGALDEGLALAHRMPYPYAEAGLLHVYAELLVEQGEARAARGLLAAAVAIFRRLGARWHVERVEETLARLDRDTYRRPPGTMALTDTQWGHIEPLLAAPTHTGRPRADERRTLNAILYVRRTRCAWNSLPRELGDGATAHRRWQQWRADGTWERIRGIVEHEP